MSFLDPFADVNRLRRQVERAFDEAGGGSPAAEAGAGVWRPQVDVFEDTDALTLRVDLPGVELDAVDVQLSGEELVIRGERPWAAPEKSSCVHAERPHGQFHRAFRVGFPVQHDAVSADLKSGVLTIRLPKADAVKPRKIEVRSTEGG